MILNTAAPRSCDLHFHTAVTHGRLLYRGCTPQSVHAYKRPLRPPSTWLKCNPSNQDHGEGPKAYDTARTTGEDKIPISCNRPNPGGQSQVVRVADEQTIIGHRPEQCSPGTVLMTTWTKLYMSISCASWEVNLYSVYHHSIENITSSCEKDEKS